MQEVEAIKSEEQRQQVEAHLADRGQIYLDIWKLGLNTFLRISDVLALTMAEVRQISPDQPELKLIEKKTGKPRTIALNATALEILQRRLADYPKDVWLFQSESPRHTKRNGPQPINRRSVGRVFAETGQQIRPRAQLGMHSMRKTRGYAMHAAGRSIEEICRALNHSHPAVTMRYIGLTQAEINQSFADFEL
jgi:integrase